MPAHRPIRVCYLIDNLAVAGTEQQLLALIAGLDRAKVQPYLCLLDGTSDTSRRLEPSRCPVFRLGVRSICSLPAVAAAWQFVCLLRRERIDIVQLHFRDSTYLGAPLARFAGVRRVVRTRRNIGHWMSALDRRLGQLLNRWTDATVTNCQACRQAVIAQEATRAERVVVIPNLLDLGRFDDVPAYSPNRNGRLRRVGIVAHLRPVKGIDVFVRAAAIVAASHPNVSFQIAGTGDDLSVRRLAQDCGIADRLQLLGSVNDVPGFLGGLDVAVLTSNSEGLSNSLLEYMAAGRPIVATAVGGNVDLIEDNVSGILVAPKDHKAVAAAVHLLLDAPEYATQLATEARKRVFSHHSAHKTVHRYEELYRALACNEQHENSSLFRVLSGWARKYGDCGMVHGVPGQSDEDERSRQGQAWWGRPEAPEQEPTETVVRSKSLFPHWLAPAEGPGQCRREPGPARIVPAGGASFCHNRWQSPIGGTLPPTENPEYPNS